MKKFIIDEKIFEMFPEVKIGVISAKNIDNIKAGKNFRPLILKGQKECEKYFIEREFAKNPVIASWRLAFKKFGAQKGKRSSIEALLKRVHKGEDLGTINPLVDIYNYISLKYALPCGGETVDNMQGNLNLSFASGDEEFITLGTSENRPPKEGEIVYKDDLGVICRCWNWREADRTKLTEDTRNAFLCIENIDSTRESEFIEALNELAELIRENLSGDCEVTILDKEKMETQI